MGKRILSLGSALFVVALVVVGCGGGDSTGSSEQAEALSPAAFTAQAKKICDGARQELQKVLVKYQKEEGPLNPTDVGPKAVAGTLLPVQQRESEQLEELVPPDEIADRYSAYLKAREATLKEIEDKKLSSNSELFEAFEKADRMAVKLQIEPCSFS